MNEALGAMAGAYQCQFYSSQTTTVSKKPPSTGAYGGDLTIQKEVQKKPLKSKGIHDHFAVRSNTVPITFVKEGIRRQEFLNMRMPF